MYASTAFGVTATLKGQAWSRSWSRVSVWPGCRRRHSSSENSRGLRSTLWPPARTRRVVSSRLIGPTVSSDVARLGPLAEEVRLGLLIDEGRGLSAFSLEQGGHRALVVAGQRREERARIADRGAAEVALRRGVRTLVAGEGRP